MIPDGQRWYNLKSAQSILPPMSPDVLKLNPQLQVEKPVTPSKYKNARAEARGMTFQSGREAAGVAGLIMLEEQQQIFGLRLQVRFPLAGSTSYISDACYLQLSDKSGQLEIRIVDFKGYATREFKLKSRLFKERYGLDITLA